MGLVSFRSFLELLSIIYFLYLKELPSFLQEGMFKFGGKSYTMPTREAAVFSPHNLMLCTGLAHTSALPLVNSMHHWSQIGWSGCGPKLLFLHPSFPVSF